MRALFVLYSNLGIPYQAAASLWVGERSESSPLEDIKLLTRTKQSFSIKEFLETQGITIQDYMEKFPGLVKPANPNISTEHLTWKSPLALQRLPLHEAEMKRLADWLDMLIFVFELIDDEPDLWYSVSQS